MAEKITKETILGDILKKHNGAKILKKYKLPCLSCPMAALEMGILKIGDVSRMYGIDIDNLCGRFEDKTFLADPPDFKAARLNLRFIDFMDQCIHD